MSITLFFSSPPHT